MTVNEGDLGSQKSCIVCGRSFGWRKRWGASWAEIQHCSPKCARRRMTAVDTRLEQAIVELLQAAPNGAMISPNDAARLTGRGWRSLTDRARDAARRLCARGAIEFVQGDRVVNASSAKGPVKVRLVDDR